MIESINVMRSMDGIRKLSVPNITRHNTVLIRPVKAGIWSLDVSHCSVNDAIKRAVMENSIPSVEKGRTLPKRLPMTLPVIQ